MKIQRLVFPDKGRCDVEELNLDERLDANEVLLKTRVSLISAGTELAMFTRSHRGFDDPNNRYAKYPFKPGYLAVSEVIAGNDRLKAGTHVFTPGYHATYSKAHADEVIQIPEGLSDEHATFYGLCSIAVTAVHVSPVTLGANVVVIGMGIVGNLCAQFYNLTGAGMVAGADLSEKRLARATLCGIPKLFNTGQRSLAECVKEFGDRGAEWIIEAVGSSKAIAEALRCAPRKGKVVLLGSPRTVMEIDPYNDIHRGGVQVIGAHGNAVDPTQRRFEGSLLMNWLRSGKLQVQPLITQHMALGQALQAYQGLRDKPDDYMGVMLTYS